MPSQSVVCFLFPSLQQSILYITNHAAFFLSPSTKQGWAILCRQGSAEQGCHHSIFFLAGSCGSCGDVFCIVEPYWSRKAQAWAAFGWSALLEPDLWDTLSCILNGLVKRWLHLSCLIATFAHWHQFFLVKVKSLQGVQIDP